MQSVRKAQKVELTEELKELHEEMMVHYQRGKYIIPVKENAGTLVMKQKKRTGLPACFYGYSGV